MNDNRRYMKKFVLITSVVLIFGCTTNKISEPTQNSCVTDPKVYEMKSHELQKIVTADQAERTGNIDWTAIEKRDEARRKKVAEIFAEGCFKSAADYAAAALVFQHGNSPDHFFQTFTWAKKAVELGDKNQLRLMTLGLDRYLINIGHKQLFATQAGKPAPESCWCLEPVESKFPQTLKIKYSGKTLEDEIKWLQSLNKDAPSCSKTVYCSKNLKPTTKSMTFGIWQ